MLSKCLCVKLHSHESKEMTIIVLELTREKGIFAIYIYLIMYISLSILFSLRVAPKRQ